MKASLKYFFIILGIAIILYIGFWIYSKLAISGVFEKSYTMKNAIDNYNKKEQEINDLISYFNTLIPSGKAISFGLGENNSRFNIGIALPDGAINEKQPNIGGSNLKLHSNEADSLLSVLNWTNETAVTLMTKLKNANCLNIMSGDPIRIEYRYSGIGLFTYLVFNKPLTDSVANMYKKELGDPVIRSNVVIIYTTSL
jgi:hypothetical protein